MQYLGGRISCHMTALWLQSVSSHSAFEIFSATEHFCPLHPAHHWAENPQDTTQTCIAFQAFTAGPVNEVDEKDVILFMVTGNISGWKGLILLNKLPTLPSTWLKHSHYCPSRRTADKETLRRHGGDQLHPLSAPSPSSNSRLCPNYNSVGNYHGLKKDASLYNILIAY